MSQITCRHTSITRFKNNAPEGTIKWQPVVKCICCSCRGPGINSQHQYGGSQPPVTLVPKIWRPLLATTGTRHADGTQPHTQTKHTENENIQIFLKQQVQNHGLKFLTVNINMRNTLKHKRNSTYCLVFLFFIYCSRLNTSHSALLMYAKSPIYLKGTFLNYYFLNVMILS